MSTTMISADHAALDELIAHIRQATTDLADATLEVPVAHYVSAERADRERALLMRLPLVVAHISEVSEPGRFVTRDYMGVPILIVGQRGGGVKVYRNMCRHRGGMVEMAPSGKRAMFMCQYHGWSYAAAEGGALKVVPPEDTSGGIDKGCRALIELPSQLRHGLVWAQLSEGAMMPVETYLGPEVDNQIAPWKLEDSVVFMDHVMDKQINWKIVVDGTLDSLHAPFLHGKPGGVGALSVNHAMVFREYGRHGKMIMGRRRLKRKLDAGEVPEPDLRTMASVMLLYPNTMFVEAPDHIELWSIWPDAEDPQRSTVRIRFLVRSSILTPDIEERIHRSWEILRLAATEEDFPMEEAIQRNARVAARASFTYGQNEKSAQHLHRQLFQDIDGGVEGPGTLQMVRGG